MFSFLDFIPEFVKATNVQQMEFENSKCICIHVLKRSLPPLSGSGKNFVSYQTDCYVRNIHAVNILKVILNIRGRHSLGVH